ncbi:MAG: TonB-dependent receptor, partial [Novosphingobium sp.]
AKYDMPTGIGTINWSLSANYNENKVDSISALPSALYTSTVDPTATALIDKFAVWTLEKSTPKVRATLGMYWESGMFSVNLRESYYSKVSSLSTAPGGSPLAGQAIAIPVKASFITDLEVGFKPTEAIKISIGANNLFNHYPTKTSYENIRAAYETAGSSRFASSVYPTVSPFGINGGYYYARLGVNF